MSSSGSKTPKALSLVIESPPGVTEYVIELASEKDATMISLLGARVAVRAANWTGRSCKRQLLSNDGHSSIPTFSKRDKSSSPVLPAQH